MIETCETCKWIEPIWIKDGFYCSCNRCEYYGRTLDIDLKGIDDDCHYWQAKQANTEQGDLF